MNAWNSTNKNPVSGQTPIYRGADAEHGLGHDPDSESLASTQQSLTIARRRFVGAAVLLLLACGLIPMMLDNKQRAWGEDVVLKMPKSDAPYSATLATPATKNTAKSSLAAPDAGTAPAKPVKP